MRALRSIERDAITFWLTRLGVSLIFTAAQLNFIDCAIIDNVVSYSYDLYYQKT